jgi:regulator of protease activity HflC (stomatin/prohibitin superfamily)
MSETTEIKPMTDDELNTFIAIVIVVSLLVLFLVIFIQKTVVVVRQASVMIIERWGQFHAVYKPGFHFIIPFMETARCINWRCMEVRNNSSSREIVTLVTDRIDLREHVIDFGRQHVITHDTVEMYIDALVYFRIVDARLAVLEIQNLPDAVELLTQASLRNVISNMTLDDTFSSREKNQSSTFTKNA